MKFREVICGGCRVVRLNMDMTGSEAAAYYGRLVRARQGWRERTEALPPLAREVVEAIAPAWVATQEELEDEARTVMNAFATWLDAVPDGLRPSDLAAEVRRQVDAAKPTKEEVAHEG